MREIGNLFGWTPRFQRMFALWMLIGVSPVITVVQRVSDVTPSAKAAVTAVTCGIGAVAACWCIWNIVPATSEEPMRERESVALGLLVAFDLTLITYSAWYHFFR
jgi:hypothetical protein